MWAPWLLDYFVTFVPSAVPLFSGLSAVVVVSFSTSPLHKPKDLLPLSLSSTLDKPSFHGSAKSLSSSLISTCIALSQLGFHDRNLTRPFSSPLGAMRQLRSDSDGLGRFLQPQKEISRDFLSFCSNSFGSLLFDLHFCFWWCCAWRNPGVETWKKMQFLMLLLLLFSLRISVSSSQSGGFLKPQSLILSILV